MDDRNDKNEESRERSPGPRKSSESVRIIGADEAAAAIEAGQAAGRRPDDAPRFGDVPPAPEGPRPPLRFPMPGSDPSSVAKPPIVGTPTAEELEDEAYLEGLTTSPPDEPEAWAAEPEAWPTDDEPESWTEADEPESWTAAEEDDWGVEPEPPAAPPRPATDSPTLVTPARGVELPHWTEPGTGEVPAILGEPEPGTGAPEGEEELAWSAFSAAPRWRDQPSDWEEPDFEAGTALSDDETRVGALDTGQTEYSDLYSFDEPEPAPPPVEEPPPPLPQPPPVVAPTQPAYEPTAEALGPPAERDLPVAIGAGIALGVAVLVAAKIGAAALVVLVTAVLVVASFELYETLRTRGYHPATLLGLVGTASMMGAVYWKGEDAMPLVLSLFVVFAFLWYLAGVVHARPAMNVAITIMAFMYVGFLGSFAALLLRIPGGSALKPAHDGVTLFLLPVIATVAYDVGAYAIGGRTGRTPLAPSISPNKTWEGLVGATIITFAVTLIVQVVFKVHPWTLARAFWLAAIVCVAAPLGDLAESMIKRDLGVKDMGRVMPGHGGVLDRIDGLLFVAPAAYYLLRILKFA